MAFDGASLTQINNKSSGECKSRSDCTYVQADLALNTPQNKCMVANGGISVHSVPDDKMLTFIVTTGKPR